MEIKSIEELKIALVEIDEKVDELSKLRVQEHSIMRDVAIRRDAIVRYASRQKSEIKELREKLGVVEGQRSAAVRQAGDVKDPS